MRIASGGSVGIGTTSPAARLDVAGEIRTTGNTLACSSTTAGAIRYNSSSKAFDYCGGATPAWTAFGGSSAAGSSGQVQFNSGGALAGASGLVYLSNGNVGIGTASPADALQIVSSRGSEYGGGLGTLRVQNTSTSLGAAVIELVSNGESDFDVGITNSADSGPGTAYLDNRNNTAMRFLTNDVERMRITNTGYVGIGTTSPQAALDVIGDIHYSGSLADVSDRRAKLAIQALPPGQLHRIMQLAPVSFIMKNDPKQRTELGLIAQDVEPLYPDLVQTDATGMKSMNYVSLISPVIKAMQEQQDEIRALWAGLIVAISAAFAACFVLWRVRHRLTGL